MRNFVLISLLSAAVVIASDPAINYTNATFAPCTNANITTACASVISAYGEACCATITPRNETSRTNLISQAVTMCYPRRLAQLVPVSQADENNITHSISCSNTVTVTYTQCTNETSCDNSSCCVETEVERGTKDTYATINFCGARSTFLDQWIGVNITSAQPLANHVASMGCERDLNPTAYTAKWGEEGADEDSARLFNFSMAVIMALLALFAY